MSFFWGIFRKGPRYSFKKVALLLSLSMLSITTLFLLIYLPLYFRQRVQMHSPAYKIKKMILVHRTKDELTSPIFAELLSLSVDRPVNYAHFAIEGAQQQLVKEGIFSTLSIRKKAPDTLIIVYGLYEPFFVVGDQTNRVVSKEGHLMPYRPYYNAHSLPTLYLGEESIEEHFTFLQELVSYFKDRELAYIDIREIKAKSKAKREVVLCIKEGASTHFVRLYPFAIKEQLSNYFVLLPHLSADKERELIIDLRIAKSGYLTMGNDCERE